MQRICFIRIQWDRYAQYIRSLSAELYSFRLFKDYFVFVWLNSCRPFLLLHFASSWSLFSLLNDTLEIICDNNKIGCEPIKIYNWEKIKTHLKFCFENTHKIHTNDNVCHSNIWYLRYVNQPSPLTYSPPSIERNKQLSHWNVSLKLLTETQSRIIFFLNRNYFLFLLVNF